MGRLPRWMIAAVGTITTVRTGASTSGIITSAYIPGAAGAEVGRSSFTRTVCRWGSAMGKICATRTSTQVLRMSSFARSHIPSRTPGIRRDGTSTWTCR